MIKNSVFIYVILEMTLLGYDSSGPGVGVRRLYAGMVRSRLLYGAPIWAEDLMASRRSLLKVRRLHRTVAIRVMRGFRTISAAAATVLAGFPPFELQALRCREIYLHTRGLSDGVDPVGADVEGRARRALLNRWRVSLDMRASAPELRVLEAVLPNWDVWLDGAAPPPDLQGDAGTHRARVLWRILAPNQEGSDRALPPLRCECGFGAAHVGVLSGGGAAGAAGTLGHGASGPPLPPVGVKVRC